MTTGFRALMGAVCLAAAACASTPEATPQRDAEAKRFEPRAGKSATLYVYRNDFPGNPTTEDSVLLIDDKMIGATLPGTFFRIEVPPGERELHGLGHDPGSLRIRARPGETHFVALNVINGSSYFDAVSPAKGRREIRNCCALLENWAPGQRPLLR